MILEPEDLEMLIQTLIEIKSLIKSDYQSNTLQLHNHSYKYIFLFHLPYLP